MRKILLLIICLVFVKVYADNKEINSFVEELNKVDDFEEKYKNLSFLKFEKVIPTFLTKKRGSKVENYFNNESKNVWTTIFSNEYNSLQGL